MTTLHSLRRTYALSFSELAVLTSVPVRRMAEFEYHSNPLSLDERQNLAAFFGVAETALEGGWITRRPGQPTLMPAQAQVLAAMAAVAALSMSLSWGDLQHDTPRQPVLTAFHSGAGHATDRLNLDAKLLDLVTPTAAASPSATPAPTATIRPTAAPSPTATAIPTVVHTPATPESITLNLAAASQPALPASPLRGFRLRKQPTPVPQLAESAPGGKQPASRHQAQGGLSSLSISDEQEPHRCPALPAGGRIVLTQGYNVGTHAPAAQWGGLDLAVAGSPTAGTTVVATHAGYVYVALNSWPAGNFIAISSDSGWRTAYAHLESVSVESGQYVEAGAPIGTIGSTGSATGPHLHYETWHNGVNLDPSPRLFCR